MMQLIANSTGHVIVDIDGEYMLVDTGTDRSFHDEYQGVCVEDLARHIGVPSMGLAAKSGFFVSDASYCPRLIFA
jgi:hypothetical protein